MAIPIKKPPDSTLTETQKERNTQFSKIRIAIKHCITHLKNRKILAADYRHPLHKLATRLTAITAPEFYRINQKTAF